MGEGSFNPILKYILLYSVVNNIYFTPTRYLEKLLLEQEVKRLTRCSL